MARIFSKSGDVQIIPHDKKTYQGSSKNTKYSPRVLFTRKRYKVKTMSDNRMNRHPEFLQETMFQEHGTKVLITNPNADQYLNKSAEEKKNAK